MIITFWILAVIFGAVGFKLTVKIFLQSLNYGTTVVWIFSLFVCAFSVGVIKAGSWHNVTIFFIG